MQRLLGQPMSEYWLRVLDYKETHRRLVLGDYRHYVKAMEHSLDWAAHFVVDLNYVKKDNWPQHRGIQFCFFPGVIHLLHRSSDDWIDGFYNAADIMNRAALEGLFRIVFLSCYPDDAEAVFVRRRGKGKRDFNMTNFMRDDLKLEWMPLWEPASAMVHGNSLQAASILSRAAAAKPSLVSVEMSYDKEAVTHPMNVSLFLTWCMWRLLLKLFPDFADKGKPEALGAITTVEEGLRELIKGLPNRLPEYLEGMMRAEEAIEAAESGKDWKSIAGGPIPDPHG